MMIKLLGLLDLLTIIAVLFSDTVPHKYVILGSLYLIVKGLIFFTSAGDTASIADTFCGLYFIMLIAGYSYDILTLIAILYLAQKAALSLFS